MNIEQIRDKVYEEIADKTLSFGCRVIVPSNREVDTLIEYREVAFGIGKRFLKYMNGRFYTGGEQFEIIGHPIHIGVVMQWIVEKDAGAIEYGLVYDGVHYQTHDRIKMRPNPSQPIPLPGEPVGEEWNDVLLFLNELLGHQ